MATRIDGDQLAARILLGGGTDAEKQRALTAAAKLFAGKVPCPECGSGDDMHEDNGRSPGSIHYTVLCTACGHQWMPNDG